MFWILGNDKKNNFIIIGCYLKPMSPNELRSLVKKYSLQNVATDINNFKSAKSFKEALVTLDSYKELRNKYGITKREEAEKNE